MILKSVNLNRKLLHVTLAAFLLIMFGHELKIYLPDIEQWIQHLGAWAPMGFIALFVLATPLFISVDALCFAAGVLFPLISGEFYMIVATYLSATFIFLLGRYLFKDRVRAYVSRSNKLSELDSALAKYAFKIMFLLRLTPLPFAMLSYSFSVAPVRFWPYLTATSGILIYNATLVYLGYTTKHISGLVSGRAVQGHISYPLLATGLIMTLAILFFVSKLAGKTLNKIRQHK